MVKRASIKEVADLEEVEVPFLGEIYCSEANFWTAIVKVDGHETHFKLDTAAAVSIVSNKEPWLKDYQLTKSQQILRAILQESEAKLEMKNFKPPSIFVWR